MRHLLLLAALTVGAGCADREVNPDAAKSRIADQSHCPWSAAPYTTAQDQRDCPLEPPRAFPRPQGDNSGTALPGVNSQPLTGLTR